MRYIIPRDLDGSLSTTMVSRHDDDGSVAFIPLVAGNADAVEFEKWKEDGGVPEIASPPSFDTIAVKTECGRRIYAVAGDSAQKNMLATIVAGGMSDADKAVFDTGVAWIAAMQGACRALVTIEDETFGDDAHWPRVPPGVTELAARF